MRHLPLFPLAIGLLFMGLQESLSQSCRVIDTIHSSNKIGGCQLAGPPYVNEICEELRSQWGSWFYEVFESTEVIKLCQYSSCDSGEVSSPNEYNHYTGYDDCTQYSLYPLPNADPELCGSCPCEDCPPGLGSIKYKMKLGRGFDGLSPHFLWIHQEEISKTLFTPRVLSVMGAKGLKVYRNPDYTIRQVLSVSTLADVVILSPESFRVDLYAVDSENLPARGEDGFLVPRSKPYRSHTFSNPDPGSLTKFEALESSGESRKRHLFEWNREEDRWALRSGGENSSFETISEKYDAATRTLVKTWQTVEPTTGITKETIRTFRDWQSIRQLLSTEKRINGREVSKDLFDYYDDAAEPGARGHLKARRLHDGSWEKFAYDSEGRLARKVSPWKDSPFDAADEAAKVEVYTYPPLSPASPYFHSLAQMSRVDTMIEGTTVSTAYRIRSQSMVDGGPINVEVLTAQPGSPLEAKGNHLTINRYYPVAEADPSSGKLKSSLKPDGSLSSYTYESGDYTGEEGVPGDFEPRIGGYFTRVTEIPGTEKHPNGFPVKSVATVAIQSPSGKDLLVETRIRLADSEAYTEVVSWTGHAYDDFDRKTLSRDATGLIAEYRYNLCCGKLEWERDRNGTETSYVRDENDRVTAKIVKAPGRPAAETHYEYGRFGQVVSETVLAGELVQETTREYDDEGELIATTTPDGLTTRYLHDHEARIHTVILPGGATQVETRYLDGQVKAVTGTAVVAQHYDYGVTPDTGLRWTQTTLAKADGPRWTRSHVDARGQAILQEQPGHGNGVVLATHTAHDEKGRPVASQSGWKKIATGADGGRDDTFNPVGPVTLQTYDAETGEPLFSGQDLNRDEKLAPGQTDRVAKTERRLEQIGNHWWEVSRQWTYPLELKGQPYLVGESRQRLTGLGIAAEDPALGVLVSETIQMAPSANEPQPQKGAQDAKTLNFKPETLNSRSVTYRHRETGVVTTVSTDPKGLVSIQSTQGGLLTKVAERQGEDGELCCEYRFSYDSLGRRVGVQDPRTGESKTVYDPKTGQVIAQIDPENRATRYAYYPGEHPSAGKLAYSANAEGKEQHVAYTARGEQRAVWGASVQPLLYEYNDYGEMVGMKTFQTLPNGDPGLEEDKGAKTAWYYHEATGSLIKKEYADGHGPTYAYSEAGQLKERQWARETNTTSKGAVAPVGATGSVARSDKRLATAYTYDGTTAQLTQSTSTDGTEVTYEYNPEGQLAKVTDATGTREFAYDIRGQILKESVTLQRQGFGGQALQPDPAAVEPIRYEIRRTYTPLGQPESVHLVSVPSNPASEPGNLKLETENLKLDHRVDYAWNAHGQLASVKSLAGEFVYEYDEENPALLTKMTCPVHEVETTYEPHRNLITGVTNRILTPSAARRTDEGTKGRVVSSYVYGNDVLGRRETISQGGEAFAMLKLGENKVDVAYNDRSELVGASYRSGKETRQQFDYDFDGIGNRTTARSAGGPTAVGGGQTTETKYESNALNQYSSIRVDSSSLVVQTPSHDLDGNLIEDHKNRYTWDAENRLVRVDAKDGSLRLDYVYDHQSRRTVRTETKQPGTKNEERRTTYYLYDAWNLLAEIEAVPAEVQLGTLNFKPATLLSWGRDLSGSLQGAGGVGGLLAISDGEVHRFPAYDANGNVGQLIKEQGEVVAAYTYDPFGNVTEMAGAEARQNPWRFSTKPVEAETEWMYYGFRYYSPETGKWTSRDPIEESGGFNLYRFLLNGGVNTVDILGREGYADPSHAGYHGSTWAQSLTASDRDHREYCGLVCKCKTTSVIKITAPHKGPIPSKRTLIMGKFYIARASCFPSFDMGTRKKVSCPDGWQKIAAYHSHPETYYDSNQFSDTDKSYYEGTIDGDDDPLPGDPIFLGAPNRTVRVFAKNPNGVDRLDLVIEPQKSWESHIVDEGSCCVRGQ